LTLFISIIAEWQFTLCNIKIEKYRGSSLLKKNQAWVYIKLKTVFIVAKDG